MKRYRAGSTEGEIEWGQSLEKTRHKLSRALSVGRGVTQGVLITQQWMKPFTSDNSVECYLLGKLPRDSIPRVFIGSWAERKSLYLVHTVVSDFQRKAEIPYKPCCSHTVQAQWATYIREGGTFWIRASQKPAEGQACKQNFQRIMNKPAKLTLSYTVYIHILCKTLSLYVLLSVCMPLFFLRYHYVNTFPGQFTEAGLPTSFS